MIYKKNAKLNAWYETLQERKASGQSVGVWCQENGTVRSTYYYWQKKVREALEARLGLAEEQRGHFVALLPPRERDRRHERPEGLVINEKSSYALGHKDYLMNVTRDGRLELTNNRALSQYEDNVQNTL